MRQCVKKILLFVFDRPAYEWMLFPLVVAARLLGIFGCFMMIGPRKAWFCLRTRDYWGW